LSGGAGSVPGAFTFTNPATAPPVGTASHSVTFTPTDTNNYQTTSTTVEVLVAPALTTITTPPTATTITYGQTLANSTLSGGAGSVPGSFAFTAPDTQPNAGTTTHSVTFTPADTNNYQTAATSVSVTVNAALTPFEDWADDPAHGLTPGVNDDPLDDPDFDGYSNLLEFVLGGEPMVSSQVIQPKLTQVGGNWVFSYDRSHLSASSTTQVVEYGRGLTGWTPLAIPAETAGAVTVTPGASSDHVEVIIPPQGINCFTRFKVSQ
jgi:hypothetical protein